MNYNIFNQSGKSLRVLCLGVLCAVSTLQSKAQTDKKNQEVIIIEDDKMKNENTTIEIKNGQVYVDGKKVADDIGEKEKNVKIIKKKVIVNGKELNDEEAPAFGYNNDSFDNFEIKTNRPMLGVSTKPTANNDGAEVERIVPNSPAQKIGLEPGDVITKVNDKNIQTPKDLVEAISQYQPGTDVNVTYERNNKMSTKNVKLSENKDVSVFRGNMMPFDMDIFRQFENGDEGSIFMPQMNERTPKIGIAVEDRQGGKGVLITEVTDNSAAQNAGLQKDDIITMFDMKDVNNIDELLEVIADAKTKEKVSVEILRSGTKRLVTLNMPKNIKKRKL